MFKTFILISCIALLLQTGYAARTLNNPQAFDPQKCMESATKAAVCFTDFWTNFGRPSAACCKALEEMDDTCIPSLFPKNPFIAPFLQAVCSGSTGGGLPFPPFPFPFPFPPIGGGSGGLPFPFPPVGGGSGGLPFPFPPVGGGGGSSAPPPKA